MENFKIGNSIARPLSFHEAEFQCQDSFQQNGPYWHLCTDGTEQQIIFRNAEDFCAAMNALAIVLAISDVRLIAFALMNNHIHLILAGDKEGCKDVFRLLVKRLKKYYKLKGRPDILDGFVCGEPIEITSLAQMRIEIAYVHRNPFVARADSLPYSYRWSSGSVYFNDMAKSCPGTPFNKLPFALRTNIFQGRVSPLPDNYKWSGEYIYPSSFVCYQLGESFFRNAAEYFVKISKIQEDHCLMVQKYGEDQLLNYEEGYSVAASLAYSMYKNHIPSTLLVDQKKEVAKKLHYEYHVPNKQIASLLKMEISFISQMFPKRQD